MYTIRATIVGTAPLLQHRFGPAAQEELTKDSRKNTGVRDFSLEWLSTLYGDPHGYLVQPASHVEGSLVRAASSFKVKGQRSKTWKEPVKAYVYVTPACIPHLRNGEPVPVPGLGLMSNPTPYMSVSVMRAVVQRAAVARSRLMLAPGWELTFTIEVVDDQLPGAVLREILVEAGRAVGIGDYRPRYGRFAVTHFDDHG